MAAIKIRVGAAADASLTTIFRQLTDVASRARKQIEQESKKSSKAISGSMKEGTSLAEREFKELARSIESDGGSMMTKPGDATKAFASEAQRNFDAVKVGFKDLAREADRTLSRLAKKPPMTAVGFINQQLKAGSTTRGVLSGTRAALGFGARIAGDFARGAGVDIDLTSNVAKQADLQKRVLDIANSGFMPGAAGPNGQRQDPREIERELSRTATATGFGVNEAAEGLQAFVGKTGDLDTGRKVFADLAKLSRATGTNLEDMVAAAGDVSNQLGDIPHKSERIQDVMRAIAGQGKLGAVEVRDLAAQMAKVAASANLIQGNAGDNIGILGTLAQESRARGGSASATQAATSVQSFMNMFSKGARLDAFKSFGVEVQGANGLLRDPRKIILDAIQAASTKNGGMKNFSQNMGDMFKDVRARSVTRGFESIFMQAGGGEKGMAAVSAEMDRLSRSVMGGVEVQESFTRAMQSSEAQANAFNNQLQSAVGDIENAVLPGLVALAPAAIKAAQAFGDFASGLGAFLKKYNIGGVADAEQEGREKDNIGTASTLGKSARKGTVTQADIDNAQTKRAALDKDIAAAWVDLNKAKAAAADKAKDGALDFNDTHLGKLIAKIDPTGGIQDIGDRKSGGVGLAEHRLADLETQHIQLDRQIDAAQKVMKVHITRDTTQPLIKPQAQPVPVESR